jgi:hypothetical protein
MCLLLYRYEIMNMIGFLVDDRDKEVKEQITDSE